MNARRAHSENPPGSAQIPSGFPSPATTSPDRVAWSTHSRDEENEYLDRTSVAAEQLAARVVELALSVRESTAGGSTFGGSSGSMVHAQPPLRLDRLDALTIIGSGTGDLVVSARRVLSLPPQVPALGLRATVGGLLWLAGVIASVWNAEPSTGRTSAQGIWRHHARAGRLLGLVSSAFRIDERCPACAHSSLWVDPDSWSVACGLAECGYTEVIAERPVRWVSE